MIYQRPVNPSSTCKTCNYLTRIMNSRNGKRYCSFLEEYVDEDSLCPEHT